MMKRYCLSSTSRADSIIVIWFKLLCMAGKQNNSGVFYDELIKWLLLIKCWL